MTFRGCSAQSTIPKEWHARFSNVTDRTYLLDAPSISDDAALSIFVLIFIAIIMGIDTAKEARGCLSTTARVLGGQASRWPALGRRTHEGTPDRYGPLPQQAPAL
jgi:hypothetical protein